MGPSAGVGALVGLLGIVQLAVTIFLIVLAVRFVRATERIASAHDRISRSGTPRDPGY